MDDGPRELRAAAGAYAGALPPARPRGERAPQSGSVSTAELRDELAILMQPEGKVRAQRESSGKRRAVTGISTLATRKTSRPLEVFKTLHDAQMSVACAFGCSEDRSQTFHETSSFETCSSSAFGCTTDREIAPCLRWLRATNAQTFCLPLL